MIRYGRIGKITPKAGGAVLHVLPAPKRSPCRASVEQFAKLIDEETAIAGYFVLKKSGEVITGFSYDAGVGYAETLGAVEVLKEDIRERWDEE